MIFCNIFFFSPATMEPLTETQSKVEGDIKAAFNAVQAVASERHVIPMGTRICPETGQTIYRHRYVLKIEDGNEEFVKALMAPVIENSTPGPSGFSGTWRYTDKK